MGVYARDPAVNYCLPRNTIACSLSDNGKTIERCLGKEYICNGYLDCPRMFDDEYGCPYGGECFSIIPI